MPWQGWVRAVEPGFDDCPFLDEAPCGLSASLDQSAEVPPATRRPGRVCERRAEFKFLIRGWRGMGCLWG